MDEVLLRLVDAQRAVQTALALTPEAAALNDLWRLIERAHGGRYEQHARSMTQLAARIQDYLEGLPLFGLFADLGALIERRTAMLDVQEVGDMDLVRVIGRLELWDEMPTEPGVEE